MSVVPEITVQSRADRGGGSADEGARPVRRHRYRLVVAGAALALVVTTGHRVRSDVDRTSALAEELGLRGLVVDREGVAWLDAPPLGALRSLVASVPVVARAAPGEGEPHDVFLAYARLSPEGVLLDVGTAYNLTETSAVDEGRPVTSQGLGGASRRFAFVEQPLVHDARPNRIRLFDLERGSSLGDEPLTRLERVQIALTNLQHTGRFRGVARYTYTVEPAPHALSLTLDERGLSVTADDRRGFVDLAAPTGTPDWLEAEEYVETKPGNLETWSADRLRDVSWIGEEGTQYLKQVRLRVLSLFGSSGDFASSETAEASIAEEIGDEQELAPVKQAVPVDPDIGFPPPPLELWVTPALQGEGEWNPKTDDPTIRTLPGLGAAFATTFIRSDRTRKQSVVYIALWDPRQVELHTMAGVAEPKSATGETGAGMVPRDPSVLRRLAATCNAGFQAEHGEFGMMSDGVIYLPPKPYAATVGVLRDGSTVLGTWPNDPTLPDDMMSYRQNMTVLVQDGTFNPYGRTWWGGTPPDWADKTHTVRTGMCLTAESFIAYFYGADLSPEALAQAMIQARCSYGLALDMNAGHSGLEFYRVEPAAEFQPLGKELRPKLEAEGDVPDMEGWKFRGRRFIAGMGLMYFPRYIKREARDYFYMLLRDLLPGPPPPGVAEGAGWRVKGLPQHGFPYALALGEAPLAGGGTVRLLAIDPRMLTTSASAAQGGPASPSVVAAIDPGAEGARGELSLWVSPDAFAVAPSAPVPHAVRLLSGLEPDKAPAKVAAAAGVQDERGMLVYAEALDPGGAAPKALVELLGAMGVRSPLLLERTLGVALGGDTDLAGGPKRLRTDPAVVHLYRKAAVPGGRRVFQDTPIVPMREWHPLQSQRIRYFKKPKGDAQ
ncbi:MAG: hypothetical protein IT373_14885 [Polyangiaceae bacterium]|nr:hypothetical protein [Polyangiaceae bacterium]